MEKYPRGMQGPFSIPLLIKAEILFWEKARFRSGWDWQRWLNVGRIPDSLFWCPDFTDMSSHGKNPYHEQEDAKLHIRSSVITGIHHTAEWDTTCAGKYWHEIIVCAAEWRRRGFECTSSRTNTKCLLFLLIIVADVIICHKT